MSETEMTRVAMITGANRGIGRVIAREMGKRGYRIVVNWHDGPEQNEPFQRELSELGIEHYFVRADVSNAADVGAMFDGVLEHFGTINVLVNNAAIMIKGPALETSEQDFDRVLAVNLRGPFLCSQRAGRIMAKAGCGRIINISSIHQFVPKRDFTPYALSKAGLGMLTKSFALELGPMGVVVVGIAPGGVKSTMADRVPDVLIGSTPVRAIAEPEEVAEAVIYAASDSARFLNGSTILMDGGLTLGPYTRADF